MLQIEGHLVVEIVRSGRSENSVNIVSSRPVHAARVFEGKPPAAVLKHLPLLYGICRVAQSTAGVGAIKQALAIDAKTGTAAAHEILVQLETAREHLFRILIDWPGAMDAAPDAASLAAFEPIFLNVRRALFGDDDAFALHAAPSADQDVLTAEIDKLESGLTERIFGRLPAEWLDIADERQLADWSSRAATVAAGFVGHVTGRGWSGLGKTETGFLPDIEPPVLNDTLGEAGAEEFIARPEWHGEARETSSLARQFDCELIHSLTCTHGRGLLPRLAARLVELARVPECVRTLSGQLDSRDTASASGDLPAGTGISQVEAARGRLVHRVVIEDGIVRRYQILAPTEWNFHPSGVVAQGLSRLNAPDDDTLRQQAGALIQAVDPCVAYELAVH